MTRWLSEISNGDRAIYQPILEDMYPAHRQASLFLRRRGAFLHRRHAGARVEAEIGLLTLFQRFPRIRLNPAVSPVRKSVPVLNGLASLP